MQPARTGRVPQKKAKLNNHQKPLKITSSELKTVSQLSADLRREAPEIFARAIARGDIVKPYKMRN
jgi:hypothetical protein